VGEPDIPVLAVTTLPGTDISHTVKLIIEYDGTNYCGWQLQPNGISIQDVVEQALSRLLGSPVRLYSSGRTDAGVHARGMVALFHTHRTLPLRAYVHGLNTFLPPDIAIQHAEVAPEGFNPRSDAVGKQYRYTIYNAPCRSPLLRNHTWHIREPLDLAAMREAALSFVGEHDFTAFRASGCAANSSVRTITALEISDQGEGIVTIDVFGNGFLRNMVRIMAGTLAEIGQRRLPVTVVPELLAHGDRSMAGVTAPAQGLCLMKVFY